MPQVVLVAPGFFLRERPPALARLAEKGRVRRLAQLPPEVTPEAAFVGLRPELSVIADGPLIVSALGADPPARSTQFHLSTLALVDDQIGTPGAIGFDEARTIAALLPKLNTKRLTAVLGSRSDHGLVWEGRGDWATVSVADAIGKEYRSSLPEGDYESALRSFIDRSVDMLSDLEFNRKRIDEERPPLNLLWPWGEGMRPELPNLALARGSAATVESASLRMAGLTRLVGYRHELLPEAEVDWRKVAGRSSVRDATIVWIHDFSTADEDRAAWAAQKIDETLIAPLIANPEIRLSLLAPLPGGGFAVDNGERDDLPLREETVQDTGIPSWDMWQIVHETLT